MTHQVQLIPALGFFVAAIPESAASPKRQVVATSSGANLVREIVLRHKRRAMLRNGNTG
jgi:hypothetical protein